ncbi:ubiquitin carboxyl-terminal hydrolase 17-like [Andrographis paniculata]|uniref:ubiquitin carboxyl-terminal hydrolase 17-like n=1 Tax=Andrographis paniculata TaxID=175694 RepID=UPI0021E92FE1|nr:ubiquitin carboxyl-terminal hydrolase 17-like [Andrographis paniculata]
MLVIVGILLIFGLVIRCKWMNLDSKKEEVLRLVGVGSGQEEEGVGKVQAVEEYNSPAQMMPQLEKQYNCAVCYRPTSTRCSRCKAVRYCSGNCQIMHWRQGHKDDCKPAMRLHARNGSEYETAAENQFEIPLKDAAKKISVPSQDLDDSASSSSSSSCLFSSTEQSETSLDTSIGSVGESGTPIRRHKTSSSALDSQRTDARFDSHNTDVSHPFPRVYSVNQSNVGRKSEDTFSSNSGEAFNSIHVKDKGEGFGAGVYDEFRLGAIDSRSSRPSMSLRTPSAEDAKIPDEAGTEMEVGRVLTQSTGKGLKTSVKKFMQHFRAPKQSKTQSIEILKDSGGNYNHKVTFPLKLFLQLYSCDDVELHPFGLVNCGNSCYANAVLQSLIFTRPIASYLLKGLHSKTCWKRGWCFVCKFEHLVQKGQETSSPLSPVGLLSQIQPIGREEDAHEFLRNVVDKMQSICLDKAGASGSVAEDSTLMGLTFGGYLRSKIKCMKCFGRSEQCDRMMDLNVEIDGSIYTLEEALSQFTSSETLGGDDKYKCSRCKSYEKATKRLSVLEAPNILTIVLKRFQTGNLGKLNKLVRFPEVLNLSPYMSGIGDKQPTYQLYAVVVHLGSMNTADSGHYVSYIKDFRGNWFRVDDSKVSHVDLETVLSVEAYILFYSRLTPRVGPYIRNNNKSYDGKTKASLEAISSGHTDKKIYSKTKLSSSCRDTGLTTHKGTDRNSRYWLTPNDFTDHHPTVDPEGWGVHSRHRSSMMDYLSDSSSIFSTSDAGSYSTDSTKDSSAEDISGYIFGSSWLPP